MLKTGMQTAPVVDRLGPEEGYRMLREAGFDYVDFNLDSHMPYSVIKNVDKPCIFDKSDEEILEFFRPHKEAAEKYGIGFGQAHAPFPSWIPGCPESNERVAKAIEKCLMVCGEVGCPYLIVHPCFIGNDMMFTQEEWDTNIEFYTRLIPASKKYGVKICLENMFTGHRGKVIGAICQDPEEAKRYIDTLNEIAGEECFSFCLDVGHELLIGADLYTVIKRLGSYIGALHIHDNDGIHDQHVAPFMGVMNWDRFCKGLRDINYQGVLSFETDAAVNVFDFELAPELLRLMAATGRMFARRIEQG